MEKRAEICDLRTLRSAAFALAGALLAFCAADAASAGPCSDSPNYAMPDGVEVTDQAEPGIAPADLAPSPIRKALPDTYRFPLAVSPLPDRLPNASIELGDVAVDRRTGQASLNGLPLSKNDVTDLMNGCVR